MLSEQDGPMKSMSQGVTVSLLFRIMGILCIVMLSLVVCLVATVLVAFVVGLIFNTYLFR